MKKPYYVYLTKCQIITLNAILLVMMTGNAWALAEDDIPIRVSVLPVFIVPKGEVGPTQQQQDLLVRHLKRSQQEYKEMLKGRDTFQIADIELQIINMRYTLKQLKTLAARKKNSEYVRANLFRQFKVNRFNCPYIFLVMVMSPKDTWATASGSAFNGGYNSGGGSVLLSSNKLDAPNSLLQGSILHELGHAFGLGHVKSYGYDQYKSKSIMSYSKSNHWSNFTPPREKAVLIPEEIRALSMNKRVFPDLYFDREHDIPKGYKFYNVLSKAVGCDVRIQGQKQYRIAVTTKSGQQHNSKASNIVHGYIRQNIKTSKGSGFVKNHMWMSSTALDGWIDVELEFPIPVRMNRVCVLSQCGGSNYPVKAIRIEADLQGFKQVAENQDVTKDEVYVNFDQTKAKRWRFNFKPGKSGQIVIRGLRFYSQNCEIFCSMYPTHLINKNSWPTKQM